MKDHRAAGVTDTTLSIIALAGRVLTIRFGPKKALTGNCANAEKMMNSLVDARP
jgi:hypothetical protein